jgi:hypothetical protein
MWRRAVTCAFWLVTVIASGVVLERVYILHRGNQQLALGLAALRAPAATPDVRASHIRQIVQELTMPAYPEPAATVHLLIFASSDCDECSTMAQTFDRRLRLSRSEAVHTRLVVVSSPNARPSPPDDGLGNATIQHARTADVAAIVQRTGISVLPAVVLIEPDDRVSCMISGIPTDDTLDQCITSSRSVAAQSRVFFEGVKATPISALFPPSSSSAISR